jgi:hypothetical protein
MQDFSRFKRFRQEIKRAKIQYLCPKPLIGEAVGHDQRWRMFHLMQFEKKILPPEAIRQTAIADNHSGWCPASRRLKSPKRTWEPHLPR